MKSWNRNVKGERWSGTGLIVLGIIFFISSLEYDSGTLHQVGPGFFPMVVSAVILVLGAALLIVDSELAPEPLPLVREALPVLAGCIVFACTIETLGIIPAIFFTMVLSSLATRERRWMGAVLVAAISAACSWLLFVEVLDVPLRAFALDW
jgi:hypothetical protein